MSDKIDVHEHEADFQEIVQLIRKARYNALKSVNIELINLYWQVGEHISKRVENTEWEWELWTNLRIIFKELSMM